MQVDRRNQTFHLEASSWSDDVKVYIPRDFRGPVSLTNDSSKGLKYSDAVAQHLTHVGTLAFIGALEGSGFDTPDNWLGDELRLGTHNGAARVYFNDEESKRGIMDLLRKKLSRDDANSPH